MPRRWPGWLRALGWSLVVVYFLGAAAVLALQYLVLPDIQAYAPVIERVISHSLGERVAIGRIRARWEGIHAELDLSDVRFYDAQGRIGLVLPEVAAVVGWRSFVLGSLHLYSLALDRPDLHIRRDARGRLFIAGLQQREETASPGLLDWLLSQPEFVVRNASLAWDDELHNAPTLRFTGLNLAVQNGLLVHRISVRGQAAPPLASAFDLRAELFGTRPQNLLDWRGHAYGEFDRADLEAWQRWIDYPLPVRSGRGALRLWASFDHHRITEATADVSLNNVVVQLSPEVRPVEVEYLHGRVQARDTGRTLEFAGQNLGVKLAGIAALQPGDFQLIWERSEGAAAVRREARASVLELSVAAHIAQLLPLAPAVQERIAQIDPRGTLRELKVGWTEQGNKLKAYSAQSSFSGLAVRSLGPWGSFSGGQGRFEANESGGNLRLESQKPAFDVPGILPDGTVQLDSLAASVSWTVARRQTEVKFQNVSLAARDLVGTVQGSYVMPESGVGSIDLAGNFPRIAARAAYRYIPLLPAPVAEYLRGSLQSGQLTDARLRLKGDLERFPFPGGKSGVFQFSAKIANADFRFAEEWPKLTVAAGELRLEGAGMQVSATRASMLGARLANVHAAIPDLYGGDELLRVDGQADGPASEFLRFIAESPVGDKIGGATHDMDAVGPGRLQLRIDLPIRRPSNTRVAGQFQFLGGQFTFDPQLPALTQVSGRLDFTEDSLSARNLSAQIFGGPATFSIASRPDGVSITAQGTATLAALQNEFDSAWLQRASGSAPWRAAATLAKGRFELQLDSTLAGVAIALPAPLGKASGEVLPVRVNRSNRADADFLKRARVARLPDNGDAIAFNIGSLASGLLIRRRSQDGYGVVRGAIAVNEALQPLEAGGVVLSGTLGSLDLDSWRKLLKEDANARDTPLKSVRLSVDALDVAGKRFNEVKLRAAPAADGWNATVACREMDGSLMWQPAGRGRVVARLKRFTMPQSSGDPVAEGASGELPALDITAEEFVLTGKPLGRFQLSAINEARDWRIEKLNLASADGSISASGLWQSWASRPSVTLDIHIQANDAGRFLSRLGYPGTLQGGAATLQGKVGWVGSPQSVDYPTLTGEVQLQAGKGQFLRAEPGIAKLLGILSLQSWITLDFREFFGFFGEGFAFESISSHASISKGVLATNDFAMSGKSAQVSMSGTVDLARETQDLKVRVVPAVGGSVSSLVTVLANPVWGLGSLVLQRVLKDPLGRIFAFDYAVKGTWSDPQVAPLRAEALEPISP